MSRKFWKKYLRDKIRHNIFGDMDLWYNILNNLKFNEVDYKF